MKQQITIDEVIEFLNSLIAIDASAVAELVKTHVPCNEALAEHPTVQASTDFYGCNVGMLGIINGMFGVDERSWGPICWVTENGKPVRFQRTPTEDGWILKDSE